MMNTMGLSTQVLKLDSLDSNPRSGFIVVSRELHTACRLYALHCWTGTHALCYAHHYAAQHAARMLIGPCGGKVVFESISPIRIGCGFKVPCGELQYFDSYQL